MLISRKYNKNVVNAALNKAKNLDRSETLKRRVKRQNDRVVLAVTYYLKLPSLSKIIKKHWTNMTKDPSILKVFPKPPMVDFKEPPNLRNMLIHSKLPTLKQAK